MSDDLLPRLVIEPDGPVRGALLLLHGLGADGHDLAPVLPRLPLRRLGVRVILPHAPSIPVSINGGAVMPAWYDIREGDLRTRHDEQGVRASAARIEALLEVERASGLPRARLALAGFSQGGAMALHVGLRQPEPLAGIVALSTYVAAPALLETEATDAARATPIFQAHGTRDDVVTLARGQAARAWLEARGNPLEWRDYAMGHELCLRELVDLAAWLERVFGEDCEG